MLMKYSFIKVKCIMLDITIFCNYRIMKSENNPLENLWQCECKKSKNFETLLENKKE